MRKSLLLLCKSLVFIYLTVIALIYIFQRDLLYHPQPSPDNFAEQPVEFNNQGQKLKGWILNPGKPHALIYFGGNAEQVEQNAAGFHQLLQDYSIYLMPYRGYGQTPGQPTETGLFSDALFIYDQIKDQYQTLSVIGRSLGTGVAVYVAANRTVDRLVLITPYDSMARVAQAHFPYAPVGVLLKDKFESFKRAEKINAKTLILIAENDVVVPPQRALELVKYFNPKHVSQLTVANAGHNDITFYEQYQEALSLFMKKH